MPFGRCTECMETFSVWKVQTKLNWSAKNSTTAAFYRRLVELMLSLVISPDSQRTCAYSRRRSRNNRSKEPDYAHVCCSFRWESWRVVLRDLARVRITTENDVFLPSNRHWYEHSTDVQWQWCRFLQLNTFVSKREAQTTLVSALVTARSIC